MATIAEALAQAVQYHQAGHVQQAAQLYRQILQADPNQAEAWCYLGLASMTIGQLDESVRSYQQAIRLKPDYAAAHSDLGIAFFQQGKPEESVASFRQAIRCQPHHAEAYNNLGVALAQIGRYDEAVEVHRQAIQLKPDYPGAYNNLGLALMKLDRFDEAADQLRHAIQLAPDYADAYYNLALVLGRQDRYDEAISLLHKTIHLRPNYPEALNDMGVMLSRQDKLDEADAYYRKAIELRPNHAEGYYNRALGLHRQLRLDEAMACYEQALRLKPEYSDAHCDRAFGWLLLGDFERGWPEYEWRWRGRQKAARDFPQPMWDGSPLAGRTILLHAEQGRGDTIQFIRYAPYIQQSGGYVFVECQKELAGLLATCAGINRLVIRHDPLPAFHVHAPLLSLPGIFRTTLDTIPANVPYLSADPAMVERWGQDLRGQEELRGQGSGVRGQELRGQGSGVRGQESGQNPPSSDHSPLITHHSSDPSPLTPEPLRIGIAWRGDPIHKGDHQRSVSLSRFAALGSLPGIRLYSLQRGPGVEELERCEFAVTDLGSRFETFMDTAAVLMNLDLLITIDTAVAHCAGALGRPVWVMLPFAPDWRWLLEREDSAWYPTMRLFRQKQRGDWGGVFQRIKEEVERLLSGRG